MQKDSGPLVPLHYFSFGYVALVATGGIIGYAKAGTTSGTLAGIMGMRFYNSGKFMLAGLIAGASLLMVAKLGISMLSSPHLQ
ncbi:transmembrane protein 14C-like [Rattus rattus]|uniref:transmembrane protein 14C-like n=1 Tax=Rattus rattus TaxID=10117 RepID=UPI0013F2C002|nr:transmembrane protein 14C-like [Rattus rattus]